MNIFLTLDYELFSSNNPGTPQKCIVEPMNALADVADKYGVKFTIFVDAAYLYRLYTLKNQFQQLQKDYLLIEKNLKQLVERGHDIQLHFHPQWIYTEWNNTEGRWSMDTIHFKLSDMEPDLARQSFSASKAVLDAIVGYKTTCFRACGYCLDTYSDYINLFIDNGINKDSSVARYCHIESSAQTYDYRLIPEAHIYRFSESVKQQDENGSMVELSISSFKVNPIFMRLNARKYTAGYTYRDGCALVASNKKKDDRLRRFVTSKRVLASVDGASSVQLFAFVKRAENSRQSDFVVCGHPKNASEGSIRNLDRFINMSINKHLFLTSRDI